MTMIALSIRQPWAQAILTLGKCIENRKWDTEFRGRFLIHAGKSAGTLTEFSDDCEAVRDIVCDGLRDELAWTDFRDKYLGIRHYRGEALFIPGAELRRGGIVGAATFVHVLPPGSAPATLFHSVPPNAAPEDRWHASDQYGFVLKDAKPVPFVPCVGMLGFFSVAGDVASAIRSMARKPGGAE
jgi:hypothetical protein